MDTFSINKPADLTQKIELLPAGSTLEIAPGVHVPHPHAEVNLPGAGDPRHGDTKAVTERVTVADGVQKVERGPLSDDVRPRALTVNPDAKPLPESRPAQLIGGAPEIVGGTEAKLAEELAK